MRWGMTRTVSTVVLLTTAALAACTKPPPPPPPPPPPVVVIPPRPQPPLGAAPNLAIPLIDATGIRQTVNTGISQEQAIWTLRSAYNVAALNCVADEYLPILDGYKAFLKVHDRSLDKANAALDKDYRKRFGRSSVRERETYQTQVYNFFAMPPVKPAFCASAMKLSSDLAAVGPGQLEGYALAGVQTIETPFLDFFNSYDQYRADLAAWQARYEPQPMAVSAADIAAPAAATGSPGVTLPQP
jgi:hypothetical protein